MDYIAQTAETNFTQNKKLAESNEEVGALESEFGATPEERKNRAIEQFLANLSVGQAATLEKYLSVPTEEIEQISFELEDIEAVAPAVLRHRIIPNFNADAEGITVEQIVEKIVTMIPRGKGERLL